MRANDPGREEAVKGLTRAFAKAEAAKAVSYAEFAEIAMRYAEALANLHGGSFVLGEPLSYTAALEAIRP